MVLKKWINAPQGNDAEAVAKAEKIGFDLIFKYIDEITAGKVWHFSEKTHAAEDKINAAYKAFVAGGPLADLEAALDAWKNLGTGGA